MKIKEYENYLYDNNYSKNTITTYLNVLNKYNLIYKKFNLMKTKLLDSYSNANTINTHYNIICSYMKWSKDKRLSDLKKLKIPKIPKVYMNVFDKNYLLKQTTIYVNDNNSIVYKKNIIKFLFETGLRASELFNIVEVKPKTIKVLGKGNKIREIFHNYETTRLILNFNFTTKTLRKWVKEILGNIYTPHSIRRSMATHLLTNGANPKMVMSQLGHENIETTFRYLNLSLEENWNIYNKHI